MRKFIRYCAADRGENKKVICRKKYLHPDIAYAIIYKAKLRNKNLEKSHVLTFRPVPFWSFGRMMYMEENKTMEVEK